MPGKGSKIKKRAVVRPSTLAKLEQAVGRACLSEVGTFVVMLLRKGYTPDRVMRATRKKFGHLWVAKQNPTIPK